MKKVHGGDIYSYDEKMIDFSSNINPLGIQSEIYEAAKQALIDMDKYPDVESYRLRKAIAKKENVNPKEIICGNGAAEIIFNISACIKPKKALFLAPTFAEYEKAAEEFLEESRYFYLSEKENFDVKEEIIDYLTDDLDIAFLCTPNNPTGRVIDINLLKKIAKICNEKDIFLIIDECFLEFTKKHEDTMVKFLSDYKNMMILKAFTKMYSMPGLRLGYGISLKTELIDKIYEIRQPWNISVVAEKAGIAATELNELPQKTRDFIDREREYLILNLKKLGIKVYEGMANYLLLYTDMPVEEELKKRHILIRNCNNYKGLTEGYYRIAIKSHEDNETLINALTGIKNNETLINALTGIKNN